MDAANRPYPPSWVDRFIAWIEDLPIPIWLFYGLVFVALALSLHIAIWVNGTRPWGAISPVQLYNSIWFPAILGIIHNLDRLSDRAMRRFGALLDEKAITAQELSYRMTTMPARPVLAISLIIGLVLVVLILPNPEITLIEVEAGSMHPVAIATGVVYYVISYSMAPLMIFHAARQLSLVNKAYASVKEVNIFHQQPLYAFSGLTIRTALFFVALIYVSYMGEYLYTISEIEGAITFVLSSVIIPLSIAIVLLPLMGIHGRLAQAKQDKLEENGIQIEGTQHKLYVAIEKENYEQINGLDNAINSLYKVRDQLKAIPTWPWARGTFRNFLSAVLLPMVLWVMQTLAERFL